MFARALRLAGHLPGAEVSTSYGRPALKAGGKSFANICSVPGALAVHCPLELKAMLIDAAPEFYFDTPHFKGWPAVLVRMEAIDDETLSSRLESAWAMRAPKRLVKAHEAAALQSRTDDGE
jgi:hypothetical protein